MSPPDLLTVPVTHRPWNGSLLVTCPAMFPAVFLLLLFRTPFDYVVWRGSFPAPELQAQGHLDPKGGFLQDLDSLTFHCSVLPPDNNPPSRLTQDIGIYIGGLPAANPSWDWSGLPDIPHVTPSVSPHLFSGTFQKPEGGAREMKPHASHLLLL